MDKFVFQIKKYHREKNNRNEIILFSESDFFSTEEENNDPGKKKFIRICGNDSVPIRLDLPHMMN
jgi:hypothetical protein